MRVARDYDGSGRPPNQCQLDTFSYLESVWNTSSVIGLNLSVGSGKSYVARTIQRSVPGTIIITPNNALVAQYCETYPEMKRCIGVAHYKDSAEADTAFAEVALRKVPGIFNPSSYWHRALRQRLGQPSVIIVDEADAVYSMLKSFSDRTFIINEKQSKMSLLSILLDRLSKAEIAWAKNPERKHLITRYEAAKRIYLEIKDKEHLYSYKVHVTKNIRKKYTLTISSLVVQEHVQKRFFGTAKVILMSATLLPQDMELITGRGNGLKFKSFTSPIPVAQRQVYTGLKLGYTPNYKADFTQYSQDVYRAVKMLQPLGNGIVHATYSEGKRWAELWPEMLAHNQANKEAVLRRFKQVGGVLLASGMAAGIDLPGDLCRFNIIPKLHYPNLSDLEVQKRKALPDGQSWYELETLRHVMQAVGRSTRNPSDWSLATILDPRFANLWIKHKKSLPEWFNESLNFSREDILQRIHQATENIKAEMPLSDVV